ncbi:MAG TPA: hypothetical protein VNL94_06320, partial [Candidatus Binatia bacterium]|nr:hypothetical protein [Candidatus Binatia bacterium]
RDRARHVAGWLSLPVGRGRMAVRIGVRTSLQAAGLRPGAPSIAPGAGMPGRAVMTAPAHRPVVAARERR